MITKASLNYIRAVKEKEGLKLTSYWDKIGKCWTIGWGHTTGVYKGQVIDETKANQYLITDVMDKERQLNSLKIQNINQNQYDALIDFLFNIGIEKFLRSTLLRKIRINPNDTSIRFELERWDHGDIDGDGIVEEDEHVLGLTNRCKWRADLYFKPI